MPCLGLHVYFLVEELRALLVGNRAHPAGNFLRVTLAFSHGLVAGVSLHRPILVLGAWGEVQHQEPVRPVHRLVPGLPARISWPAKLNELDALARRA